MAKVLLVDDEPDLELLARQKFRKQISNGVFELLFALNGQEALDLIKKDPEIAVVVTDVNMPEMDGLTLLDKLKEVRPTTKAIIVSAYGDIKTLRAAMNRGVFDFVTKPVDFTELAESILRTLSEYQLPPSPLHTYQLLLASSFPERVDLSTSHQENNMLWDAFHSTPKTLMVLGVSILPSSIPLEIGVCTAHGILRSSLKEDPNISLKAMEEKLSKIHLSLKAHILVGQTSSDSQVFSFVTNANFKAHHISSEEKAQLKPLQTALLRVGDVITLESPSKASHLSFTRIHKR